MILLDQPDNSLLVVCQPDHAQTCGRMLERWQPPALLAQGAWRRVIDAADHHDDGWHQAERNATLDEHGRPHDFKSVPTAQHVAIWHESIRATAQRDTYVALLIALHARWLYTALPTNHADDAAAAQQFVAELDEIVDRLINEARAIVPAQTLAPAALSLGQRLLSFADGLSLALLGAIGLEEFDGLAFADVSGAIAVRVEGGGARLAPWPFTEPTLTLTTPAHHLPTSRFDSPTALQDALRLAPAQTLTFELRPR